jgi:hypothetical protein
MQLHLFACYSLAWYISFSISHNYLYFQPTSPKSQWAFGGRSWLNAGIQLRPQAQLARGLAMRQKSIIVIVRKGDRIPFDGKVLEGLALVDESAQVGVSAPAMLEAVEGRNQAIAGTLIVDGWLKIEKSTSQETRGERPAARSSSGQSSISIWKLAAIVLLALTAGMFFALAGFLVTQSGAVAVISAALGLLVGAYESWRAFTG